MRKLYIRAFGAKRVGKALIILGLAVMLVGAAVDFNVRIKPIVRRSADAAAINEANRVVSSVVSETMSDIGYDSLVSIRYDASGRVSSISADISKMNMLRSEIASKINAQISQNADLNVNIPLGSLIGNEFLSGMGPLVSFDLVRAAYSEIDFSDEMTSVGINQTRHTVYLTVKVSVEILLPMAQTGITTESTVPIASTVIVGGVPESYTAINGATGSLGDIALDAD